MIHTVEHNYISISSVVGIELHVHWVQLHVSALYFGHRQFAL